MNSKALARAMEVNKHYPFMDKKSRRSALKELAAFGFNYLDITVITGCTAQYVGDTMGDTDLNDWPEHPIRWNVKTLDAMYYLALAYENDGDVSSTLVKLTVENGTPLRSVARLTGIPIEVLRDAI